MKLQKIYKTKEVSNGDASNTLLCSCQIPEIKIKNLGFGPSVASYSLLHSYLKYLPIFSDLLLLIAFIFDSIIQIFVKTQLKEIYPIGIMFIAKK